MIVNQSNHAELVRARVQSVLHALLEVSAQLYQMRELPCGDFLRHAALRAAEKAAAEHVHAIYDELQFGLDVERDTRKGEKDIETMRQEVERLAQIPSP